MSSIPDGFSIEIIIEFLGRDILGAHRAVAKHWTLPPQPTIFVQCSKFWQVNVAAESLDKIRRDKIRNSRGRPRDWFPAPCQLCLLGPTEDDAIQHHEVGIVFVLAFTSGE